MIFGINEKIYNYDLYSECLPIATNIVVQGHIYFFQYIFNLIHPKIKILSLITHPHVVPKPVNLRSSLDHKLRYFWWNPRAFWPCIDSNATTMFKTQKGSKDQSMWAGWSASGAGSVAVIFPSEWRASFWRFHSARSIRSAPLAQHKMPIVRWSRELNALQLQKTDANRKSTSKSRKHFHHFDSRWWKCSQHKQIKKHAANAHNTTKSFYVQRGFFLFAARFFFGCAVSICSVCVFKLEVVFCWEKGSCWALSATGPLVIC